MTGAPSIDGGGLYLSPGFIDIHVHGGGGHDFMDASEEAVIGACMNTLCPMISVIESYVSHGRRL